MIEKQRMIIIQTTYWLGIVADAIWSVGLLVPGVFGALTGSPDFTPDLQVRLIMGIGASLMMGWTCLLFWAVRKPIERRSVLLMTAVPVITGLFAVALVGYMGGHYGNAWILMKTTVLFIAMVISFVLAGKMDRQKRRNHV